jgi:hypothetical protein
LIVTYPVFITCRDRLTPLISLVSWLERAGVQRICLVDNASTYEPLLEWYERSPHLVVRLSDNVGQLAPWTSNTINTHAYGESYVVTDPDVVPDERCPLDAIDYFRGVLDEHPEVRKVGFGLRIDDLPRRFRLRRPVQAWESQFWLDPLPVTGATPTGLLYRAPIDTTFALYREHTPATMGPALRTGWPYVARHLPWYGNTRRPTKEEQYYSAHARGDVTSWQGEQLPVWLAQWLNGAQQSQADAKQAAREGRRRQRSLASQGRELGRPPRSQ